MGKVSSEYFRDYYQKHRERLKELMRAYYLEHREELITKAKEWKAANRERHLEHCRKGAAKGRKLNPEKIFARNAVTHALERGELVRGTCEKCGALNVEAHHPDYSKPLDIKWLCRKHHKEIHRKYK